MIVCGVVCDIWQAPSMLLTLQQLNPCLGVAVGDWSSVRPNVEPLVEPCQSNRQALESHGFCSTVATCSSLILLG